MRYDVVKVIADMVNKDPQDISGEHRLTRDLGLESDIRINLSELLEESFDISISFFEIM